MPIWLAILIQLALRIGIPELEKILPPKIVDIIETILKWMKTQPNQEKALQDIHNNLKTFCVPNDLKVE